MAAYAVHLTQTLQGTPSVFQVIAQEALGATVKPAVRKVLEYVSALCEGKLDAWLRWYDELFLLLDVCLQHHYLKHYAASFSECFYGLQRVAVTPSPEFSRGGRLSARSETASLLVLTLWPYLRDKLYGAMERWRNGNEDKKVSDRLCAYACVLGEVWCVWQLCAYARSRSPAPTPALALLGLTLAPRAAVSAPVLLRALEYAAFLVQFVRWWDTAAPREAPRPVAPLTRDHDDSLLRRYGNKCPLCLRPWTNPTVLPVSGVVYCYGCIGAELSRSGRCPVTSLPADAHTLHRLYLN